MSMHNYNSSGYLVPAKEIAKVFPERTRKEFLKLVEDGDWESANTFAEEHWPEHLPPFVTIFTLSDDAEFEEDELHRGEMYVMFEESDLYARIETPELKNLDRLGLKPQMRRWVDFA